MKEKSKDIIIEEAVQLFKEGKIKSSEDVENYLDNLLQPLMQKLLDTELENHLEYPKYNHVKNKNNARNGYCKEKNVKTKYGNIKVSTPRDRNATFEPIIIEKRQNRLTGFEDKCISLYAKGMSVRDIENTLKDIYKVHIGKDQIVKLISTISEEVEKWQNRKLKTMYVFTYADCIQVNVKEELTSNKKSVYVVIGVDVNGYKDVLGLWIDKTESSTFWAGVFEDIKERGVKDILYVCSDGIAGFKDTLEMAYPKTQSQRCVVHLVRNIYKLCPRKEAKEIIQDYKKIYTSSGIEEATMELETFIEKYQKYKMIVKKVKEFMKYIEPLYELPEEIRKCIYTTNVIESVNSALRKVTRGKGAFPSEEAVMKVLYLRIKELTEKWKKPIQNWNIIQKQLIGIYGERYTKYLEI